MKKIIEGKRNLLISIVLYCLSISIFLISQLSIVSGTFMSGSVFSYNYSLRVAMNCLAIVCAAIAAFGKTKKLILTVKILSSIFIIAFILIFGMENNAISQTEKGGVWEKEKWVLYPISNNKNRIKMRPDTVLENFTLYCPKCKQETTINVTGQNVVVKSQEATNED